MSGIAVKTDETIHRQVLEELKGDTRVDETDVGVEVDNGVVTLTGYVDSHGKGIAAEEAAHGVVGVLDVANDIRVQPADALGRTDTQIAQAARHVLDANILIPGDRIETTVSDGCVTLRGEVDYWHQSEDAERGVLRVPGVLGVVNELNVRPQQIHAAAVRAAIEEALERRAEREAERLQVQVDDGVVTLSGRVHSWREKRAVLGAAAHAPGVRKVCDELRVDPYFV